MKTTRGLSGRVLQAGMLRMKAGTVQVEFSKGARVVIEGPAEFQLMSDNEGRMVPLAPDACHFGCGD